MSSELSSSIGSMNPQICTVQVGVKSLREVTIYPLSMADQFKMTDLLSEEINNFVGTDFKELTDLEMIEMVIDAVKRNLEKILKYVLDEKESVSFKEITNTQFTEIATKIYDVNFDVLAKNLKALKEKFPSIASRLSEQ